MPTKDEKGFVYSKSFTSKQKTNFNTWFSTCRCSVLKRKTMFFIVCWQPVADEQALHFFVLWGKQLARAVSIQRKERR
jgi:hypothetical protein